jgi:hypothetical protein
MIIRQPSTIDIVKTAALVFPDDVSAQSDLVADWLQRHTEEAFINFVVVHKKKVQGWFVGTLDDGHLTIILFKAETPEILAALWNKITQTYEIETATLLTNDPDTLVELGFEPLYVTMQYTAKGSDSK